MSYTTACGTVIPNQGEIDVSAVTDDSVDLELTIQVADVKKPLSAVRKICKAGNRVVFDDDEKGCYIENKITKARTQISFEDGTYAVNLWVPIKGEVQQEAVPIKRAGTANKGTIATSNRFSVFMESQGGSTSVNDYDEWIGFDADFMRPA